MSSWVAAWPFLFAYWRTKVIADLVLPAQAWVILLYFNFLFYLCFAFVTAWDSAWVDIQVLSLLLLLCISQRVTDFYPLPDLVFVSKGSAQGERHGRCGGIDLNLTEVILNWKFCSSKSWVNSLSLFWFLSTTAICSWFEAEVLKSMPNTPGLIRHEKCWKFYTAITEFLPLWEAWGSFHITVVT